MRFLNLHIRGFGKFQNLDISFEDGLNIVYGKNETGKSTLHTFIRGVLFGLEKKEELYCKYEPWENKYSYEGWLRVESQGEIFRIERAFHKKNQTVTIFNETKNQEEPQSDALWNRLRCGLTQTAYDNTISIGQLKSATEGKMAQELRTCISNLNTSGNIALSITNALDDLAGKRREWERKLSPQATVHISSVLEEIQTLEHEIQSPRYANKLLHCKSKEEQLVLALKERQKEKEALLEKTARGQASLTSNQFTDAQSVSSCLAKGKRLYAAHEAASKDVRLAFPRKLSSLALVFSILCLGGAGGLLALSNLSFPLPFLAVGLGIAGAISLGLWQVFRSRWQKVKSEQLSRTKAMLDLFSRYLAVSEISPETLAQFEEKMGYFSRLCEAVAASKAELKKLSEQIEELEQQTSSFRQEIEEQHRLQWELEQKLERLYVCKTQAEALKYTIAQNDRIQKEIDAIDLASQTLTSLASSVRESFGLYLNQTASELVAGITGGIYNSMSIDEELNIFLNTPTRQIPIHQISSGTMDQIYLAVRLAAAKLVQDAHECMPLVFDDSFVLYDDERLKTAMKWLKKTCTGQVIIFTCHQREAQLLTANQIPYHMIRLDS